MNKKIAAIALLTTIFFGGCSGDNLTDNTGVAILAFDNHMYQICRNEGGPFLVNKKTWSLYNRSGQFKSYFPLFIHNTSGRIVGANTCTILPTQYFPSEEE